MDVIIVFNGLGNQMSQYAFYLQKKHIDKRTSFFIFASDHNGLELDTVFGIDCKETIVQKWYKFLFQILCTVKLKALMEPLQRCLNKLGYCVIKENFDYKFKPQYLLPSKGVTIYWGGWPSEKYFENIRSQLIEVFKFPVPNDQKNNVLIKEILANNSVAIHVRRGDYLNQDNLDLFGKVCTLQYYKTAIKRLESSVENPHYFVFSNDMEWVKKNLMLTNATYVDFNAGKDSWKDMYLMTICKHNIIANSSFSWWGAWLNQNANKIVISPSRYLNSDLSTDFYPETWIRLADY